MWTLVNEDKAYKNEPRERLMDFFFPIVGWTKECSIQISGLCEFRAKVSVEIGRFQTTLLLV